MSKLFHKLKSTNPTKVTKLKMKDASWVRRSPHPISKREREKGSSVSTEMNPMTRFRNVPFVTKRNTRKATLKQPHRNPINLPKCCSKMACPKNPPIFPSVWNREVQQEGSCTARTKHAYTLSSPNGRQNRPEELWFVMVAGINRLLGSRGKLQANFRVCVVFNKATSQRPRF